MEPETPKQAAEPADQTSRLFRVTPLSKYLAMALFVILPFVGGWIWYQYAPEKVVEVVPSKPLGGVDPSALPRFSTTTDTDHSADNVDAQTREQEAQYNSEDAETVVDSEYLFETNDFSRDDLTLIEAPELHNEGSDTGWTSYHIFHDDTHIISAPGDCEILSPEFSGFRDGLAFPERGNHEVLSHVLCQKGPVSGTETLLLAKTNTPAGPQRLIIHYTYQDCGMSSDDCESYGPPIKLHDVTYSSR